MGAIVAKFCTVARPHRRRRPVQEVDQAPGASGSASAVGFGAMTAGVTRSREIRRPSSSITSNPAPAPCSWSPMAGSRPSWATNHPATVS